MKSLYDEAFHLFDGLTPIQADCGKLCGKRCCKGGKEAGMILFPGERALLPLHFKLEKRRMGELEVDFAVCGGHCRRNQRPLGCRIFPFAPYYENGVLSVRPDSRATYLCPLLLPEAAEFIDPNFLEAVQKAFRLLIEKEGMPDFLTAYTAMLQDYERFTE